jgi:hypothetical protein
MNMATLLAYCGLDCAACPARTATLSNDDELRASTAAAWSKEFGHPFTPEMINCTGCREPGAKSAYCTDCAIRACGRAKGVAHCGECADFASCATIGDFLKLAPSAKANLEVARKGA